MKKNGFSFPLNYFQVASWVVYALNILIECTIIFPSIYSDIGGSILITLTSIFILLVGILGFLLTKSNPQVKILNEHEA